MDLFLLDIQYSTNLFFFAQMRAMTAHLLSAVACLDMESSVTFSTNHLVTVEFLGKRDIVRCYASSDADEHIVD